MKRLWMSLVLVIPCLAVVRPAAAALERGAVVGEGVALRAAPDKDAPQTSALAEGAAVLVLDRSSEPQWFGADKDYWFRVELPDGAEGWLHGSQLVRSPFEARVTGTGVRLRAEPGVMGAFVYALSDGAWVTVLDRTKDTETIAGHTAYWYQVQTGRVSGWVFGAFLDMAWQGAGSTQAPFLGWRCWPGLEGGGPATAAQITVGLNQWRETVMADVQDRLEQAPTDATADDAQIIRTLADASAALGESKPLAAVKLLDEILAQNREVQTPVGSGMGLAAVLYADAYLRTGAAPPDVATRFRQLVATAAGRTVSGTNWATPADLAVFDQYAYFLEREVKDTRAAREWADAVLNDGRLSPVARAAAGAAAVQLHFAARREQEALQAARRVLDLSAAARLDCGPAPVHFGVDALLTVIDELLAVGGAADAEALCRGAANAGDELLRSAALDRLAYLQDIGTAETDAVLAAYEQVPDYRARRGDLTAVDSTATAKRLDDLRLLARRVGASEHAWVTGDRVRLRNAPSTRGGVIDTLERDSTVRVLYPLPPGLAEDARVPWVKVKARSGLIGWMSQDYVQWIPARAPAFPLEPGARWSQAGGGPDQARTAPGPEIDAPELLWRVPDLPSGPAAIADANGDGLGDLIATGALRGQACRYGLVALDGRTQAELWRVETAGCTGARAVAVSGRSVVTVTGNGTVEAFDLATGARRWSSEPGIARLTEPTAWKDLVVVADSDGLVTALDAATGAPRWTHATGARVTTPPAVLDGVAYALSAQALVAYDIARERPMWRLPFIDAPSPAPMDGARGGRLNASGTVVCAVSPAGVLLVADAVRGTPKWQKDAGGPPAGGPIVSDDVVIVACDDGLVQAWRLADGSTAWQTRLPAAVTSDMLLADHTLVVGTADGALIGLSRVDGRERWRLALDVPLDRGPVGLGGRVVIGSSTGPLFVVGDARQLAATAP